MSIPADSHPKMVQNRKPADAALTSWQAANPLRCWRESQPPEGWTRSLLARQLEVSHTAVASWENGVKLPMVDAFAKIEKCYTKAHSNAKQSCKLFDAPHEFDAEMQSLAWEWLKRWV